jgi:hypothetical protein
MTKVRLIPAIFATCLLGLLGGTVVANATAEITSPETISVRYDVIQLRYIDVDETRNLTFGNTLLLAESLTDPATGEIVGRARLQGMAHVTYSEVWTGAFDIEGRGQIIAEGVRFTNTSSEEPGFDLPITGGTDEFANVRGQVHIQSGNSYDGTITFELIP